MINMNERAQRLVRQMTGDAAALKILVSRLENGATVLDCGIQCTGSLQAGRLFAEICLGGLGSVSLGQVPLGERWYPAVQVVTDHPVLACLASQYAGWAVRKESFFAMGSGPARALYAGEALFEELKYRESGEVAVLALEGAKLPDAAVAAKVAARCGVEPAQLALLIAPTASLVGSVQVAARVIETGMHKLHALGFEINTVISGSGSCPLAPLAADDRTAIGRTNDGVLYGGRVWYTLDAEDAQIEAILARLPALASRDYGVPFAELLARYGGDFYQIDPLLFSPAELVLNNRRSGRSFCAGAVAPEILARSWLGADAQAGAPAR